jgi:hypothetical protein
MNPGRRASIAASTRSSGISTLRDGSRASCDDQKDVVCILPSDSIRYDRGITM